ncbi:MAG TPA: tyrosine--tRNA ligase [Patescibacteria group bacterium]|nr:tyrosine--tRNA ligase [Patescibacteria group bacterium]
MDAIKEVLTRGVEKIYPSREELEKVLQSGKKLRVYLGVDPTGTRLHIGHSIGLTKLQQFADAGHDAILLFGTGTVLVGDPSQRSEARKRITKEEIDESIKTWKEQVSPIIDFEKVTIKQNAEWLLKLTLPEIIELMSHISSVQLFKRDNFQKRLDRGDTVWYHETLYPLLQGYDSVAMDVDLEIGGTDQTFNMLVGRELMQKMKGKEKFVLTTPMIVGTDGNQMSKSTGNCIWLDDTPENMFGKVMSIPDDVMDSYEMLLTTLDSNETKKMSPIDRKKNLAKAIVTRFHSEEQAEPSQAYFEKTVQHQELPADIPEFSIKPDTSLPSLLVDSKLVSSKSEARRLIEQGGVEVDGKRVTDPNRIISVRDGMIIKAGKRKYVKARSKI